MYLFNFHQLSSESGRWYGFSCGCLGLFPTTSLVPAGPVRVSLSQTFPLRANKADE